MGMFTQKLIFLVAFAIEIIIKDSAMRRSFGFSDKQANRHALHNVENILIDAAIWTGFLKSGVAMQIQDIDFIKITQERPTHGAVRQAIQE